MESIFEYYNDFNNLNNVNELFNLFSKVKIRNTRTGKSVFSKREIKANTNIGTASKNDKLSKLAMSMKHSDEPNIKIESRGNKYILITIDDISFGEELTINHNELNDLFGIKSNTKSNTKSKKEEVENVESEKEEPYDEYAQYR